MPKLPQPKNLHAGFKKTLLSSTVEPGVGWFGYMIMDDNENIWLPITQWTHCRDVFQDVNDSSLSTKGMWYSYGKCTSAESICAFIEKIEEILGLDKKSFFKKTPYPDIIWIKPSPFWICDFVRRSFFTLCLRCGMRYKRMKDNFEYCMYQHYQISRDTGPAIQRFLSGYTFYPHRMPRFNTMGWHYIFHSYKNGPIKGNKLKKLLIK